jgi:hypothetical protein
MIEIGLPTASRVRVREKRRTRAAVDNPQSAEIALKKPLRTVLTSGATSPYQVSSGHDTAHAMADEYDPSEVLDVSITQPLHQVVDYIIEVVIGAENVALVCVDKDAQNASMVVRDKQLRPIGTVLVRPASLAIREDAVNEDHSTIARAVLQAF